MNSIQNAVIDNEIFTVRTENLFRADGSKVRALATVREDTNAAIGIVSDRYEIIQNTDLVSGLEAGFRDVGLSNFKREIQVGGGGSRFYARYTFADVKVELPKVGDVLGFRLTAKNNFDASGSALWEADILRLICLNGAVGFSGVNRIGQAHVGRIDIADLSKQILCAASSFGETVKYLGDLAEIQISQQQGRNAIEQLVERDILSLKVATPVRQVWESPTHAEDRGRNLYNLYNAVTQVLTHEVEPKRFELANRINAKVSATLVHASRNAESLEKLLALAS